MKSKLFVLFVVFSVLCSSVWGGINLGVNPETSGVVSFSASEIVGGTTYKFNGEVSYAVYSYTNYNGSVSVPVNNYVYAYQISGTQVPDGVQVGANTFSLGLLSGSNSTTPDTISGTGINPDFVTGNSSAVTYLYFSNSIGQAENSAVMVFSSPYNYTTGVGTLTIDTIGSENEAMPIPVPEPATMILLGAGASMIIRSTRRNRRKA